MSVEFPHFDDVVAGLALAAIPVWIVDVEIWRFVWSNEAAQEMWRAPTPDELAERDIQTGTPNEVLARTNALVERAKRGERIDEEWVFYPRGKATTVMLRLSGVTLPDGRFGLLNQAQPIPQLAAPTQRAIAISRHTSTIGAMVEPTGEILAQNPAALLAFGDRPSWLTWCEDAEPARAILASAMAGERVRSLLQVIVDGEQRWHYVDAHMLRDPVTAKLCVLVEHTDETARIEAEQVAASHHQRVSILSETLELLEQQRREILELSAPILDVGAHTLAVPIIGQLGAEQGELIMNRLLDAVANRGTAQVILDLTGVVTIDQHSASRLHALIRALRLLGTRVTVTGIRAELAMRLADHLTDGGIDLDLDGVDTLRSLADGLRHKSPRAHTRAGARTQPRGVPRP